MSELSEGIQSVLGEAASAGSEPLVNVIARLVGKMLDDDEQPERTARLSGLERTIRNLRRERKLLLQRNRLIASAVGACECWAGDGTCRRCGGMGVPGFFVPRQDLFLEIFVPLFDAHQDLLLPYLVEEGEEDASSHESLPARKEMNDG